MNGKHTKHKKNFFFLLRSFIIHIYTLLLAVCQGNWCFRESRKKNIFLLYSLTFFFFYLRNVCCCRRPTVGQQRKQRIYSYMLHYVAIFENFYSHTHTHTHFVTLIYSPSFTETNFLAPLSPFPFHLNPPTIMLQIYFTFFFFFFLL